MLILTEWLFKRILEKRRLIELSNLLSEQEKKKKSKKKLENLLEENKKIKINLQEM